MTYEEGLQQRPRAILVHEQEGRREFAVLRCVCLSTIRTECWLVVEGCVVGFAAAYMYMYRRTNLSGPAAAMIKPKHTMLILQKKRTRERTSAATRMRRVGAWPTRGSEEVGLSLTLPFEATARRQQRHAGWPLGVWPFGSPGPTKSSVHVHWVRCPTYCLHAAQIKPSISP